MQTVSTENEREVKKYGPTLLVDMVESLHVKAILLKGQLVLLSPDLGSPVRVELLLCRRQSPPAILRRFDDFNTFRHSLFSSFRGFVFKKQEKCVGMSWVSRKNWGLKMHNCTIQPGNEERIKEREQMGIQNEE